MFNPQRLRLIRLVTILCNSYIKQKRKKQVNKIGIKYEREDSRKSKKERVKLSDHVFLSIHVIDKEGERDREGDRERKRGGQRKKQRGIERETEIQREKQSERKKRMNIETVYSNEVIMVLKNKREKSHREGERQKKELCIKYA